MGAAAEPPCLPLLAVFYFSLFRYSVRGLAVLPSAVFGGNCVKDLYVPPTNGTCTFYHSDAFLHNGTAQAIRSVMLMDSYPVTPTAHSALNTERFRKLFRKLTSPHNPANTTVNILVLGGSFTTAKHLAESGGQYVGTNGSWASRLETRLRMRYPSYKIYVHNRAVGATNTLWALNTLNALFSQCADAEYGTLDLVIVDYDVNDCAIVHANDKTFIDSTLSVTEVLVRRILGHETAPAVMFLNVVTTNTKDGARMRPHCGHYDTCYLLGEKRLPVLREYGVPIVSQRPALWFNFSCPPPKQMWTCTWTCRHPLAPAYEAVANLMASFLSGESAVYSPFARALLISPESAANSGASLNKHFVTLQATNLDAKICPRPVAVIFDVDHSSSSLGGKNDTGSASSNDDFHSLGILSVQLQSHIVKLPHHVGVSNYTPSYRIIGARAKAADMDYVMASLTYSTIRVNTTVDGQPLRFAYRTCWQHVEDVPNKPGLVAEECFNLTRTGKIMSTTASVATNSVFFPVSYGAMPRLNMMFLTTWPDHIGGFTLQFVELSGAKGAGVVANLTSTNMDTGAAEAVLASLPWERTVYQDTKIFGPSLQSLGELYSMARSVNFFREPAVLTAEDFAIGQMWPQYQMKPNTTYLCRVEHVDSNEKTWETMREGAKQGGFRPLPQKVKLLSVSAC